MAVDQLKQFIIEVDRQTKDKQRPPTVMEVATVAFGGGPEAQRDSAKTVIAAAKKLELLSVTGNWQEVRVTPRGSRVVGLEQPKSF